MTEDHSADWVAPPPREPAVLGTQSLKRKAEAIVRLHRISFGEFNGRRIIDCDEVLPKRDYDTLADAMRKGLI